MIILASYSYPVKEKFLIYNYIAIYLPPCELLKSLILIIYVDAQVYMYMCMHIGTPIIHTLHGGYGLKVDCNGKSRAFY